MKTIKCESKVCTKCKEEKPIEMFGMAKGKKRSWCKVCHNACNKLWLAKNRERKREIDRIYREVNKDEIYNRHKLWVEENRDKVNERNTKWRNENRELQSELVASWHKRNPLKAREYAKVSRERYPERAKARVDCRVAVNKGILTRPTVCSMCDKTAFTEGHHSDYSKPLDVVWVCKGCHTKIHRGEIR